MSYYSVKACISCNIILSDKVTSDFISKIISNVNFEPLYSYIPNVYVYIDMA